jgi:hypothetical protein
LGRESVEVDTDWKASQVGTDSLAREVALRFWGKSPCHGFDEWAMWACQERIVSAPVMNGTIAQAIRERIGAADLFKIFKRSADRRAGNIVAQPD